MDFVWLGMRELRDVALHAAERSQGVSSEKEVLLLLEGEKCNVIWSLCCSWSCFKCSGAITLLSTKRTAARDAGSSLDPFCVANSHHLHASIATGEKVKYETAPPPCFLRKCQALANLDTCSNWLLSSTSPKAFGFPASHFLLRKKHKRRGKTQAKCEKIIQGQNDSKAKCRAGCGLGGKRKEMEHARQSICLRLLQLSCGFSMGCYLWEKMVSGKVY